MHQVSATAPAMFGADPFRVAVLANLSLGQPAIGVAVSNFYLWSR